MTSFRDKIKIAVSGDLANPVLGLAQLESSQEILNCPIHATALNKELASLIEFIQKWKLTPYSIQERRGELKALIISHSPTSSEKMLRFILRSKEALDRIRLGLNELERFKVISVNIQPIPQAILEGPEEIVLSNHSYIQHHYGDLKIFYGPQSFMQTNLALAEKLYATANLWTRDLSVKRIADLFCGSGSFALHLAHSHREVMGIEISEEAIKLANLASSTQNLKAHFSAAAAENVFRKLTDFKPELVVVNPPRRGLGLSLAPLMDLSPQYLLYSSCSPESFESDLKLLKNHYEILKGQLFDLFPHTHHFESLALMRRK